MKYFDIKMRAKQEENEVTCCCLTTVEQDSELIEKKLSCVEPGKSRTIIMTKQRN